MTIYNRAQINLDKIHLYPKHKRILFQFGDISIEKEDVLEIAVYLMQACRDYGQFAREALAKRS